MDTRSALTKRLLSALLVLAMLLPGFTPRARASAGAEPEASYESDVFSLHVGDTHQWKPFADYPGLRVAYRSSDPDVLSITSDGSITALREGEAIVTATSAKTDKCGSGVRGKQRFDFHTNRPAVTIGNSNHLFVRKKSRKTRSPRVFEYRHGVLIKL